jgi:hypothetical protein
MDITGGAASVKSAQKKSKKKTLPKKTRKGPSRKSNSTPEDTISIDIQPSVPTHVLTVQVRGPVNDSADMDKYHDEVSSLLFSCFSVIHWQLVVYRLPKWWGLFLL